MVPFRFKIFALALGLVFGVLLLLMAELFFSYNNRYHWLPVVPYAAPKPHAGYDLSGLDLSYLQNIEPYMLIGKAYPVSQM